MADNVSGGASPAVAVARERQQDAVRIMSSGVRVRIVPVSATLVDECMHRIPLPQVPMWHNPESEREEPNPNDPAYVYALQLATRDRGVASLDAVLMFGVALVDPLPEGPWLKKLQMLGLLTPDADELEIEFAYKKFCAVISQQDIMLVMTSTGVTEQQVADATESFQRTTAGRADSKRAAKGGR